MHKALLVVGLLAMGLLVGPAHADPYRYCAVYGGAMSGSENCYFMTLQQCREQISGIGGFCRPNPFYTGNRSGSGRETSGQGRRNNRQ